MSGRTIVALQSGFEAGSAFVSLRRAPSLIPGAARLGTFACSIEAMSPWSSPGSVKSHGEKIWLSLTAHPPVRQALEYALSSAQEVRPIYFLANAAEVERLAWESLCNGNGDFLALDPRWPIGRIAESEIDNSSPPLDFTPPLRLMAVLSALQVDAAEQWRKLRDAVLRARRNGLAVELAVVVGQEGLLDAIQAEIDGGTLPGVVVSPVPLDIVDFDEMLSAFAPQLLHFFCHGIAGFGSAELQIGTLNDWAQGATVAGLKLPLAQLKQMPALRQVWLLVLNCCSSGQAVGELHSLAHDLVAGGVPAAVGMAEPVGADDADAFSETFYHAVFAQLRSLLLDPAAPPLVEIDWSAALLRPRLRLVARYQNKPEDHRQWLLPALYAQFEPLRVRRGAPPGGTPTAHVDVAAEARRKRADTVAGMLRALPPDTPPATRAEILDLLADLPTELRPDAYGRFAGESAPLPVAVPQILYDGLAAGSFDVADT